MRNIYLQIEGKQVGPLPEDQIRQFLAEGKIQADALAWHEGLPEWVVLLDCYIKTVGYRCVGICFDHIANHADVGYKLHDTPVPGNILNISIQDIYAILGLDRNHI